MAWRRLLSRLPGDISKAARWVFAAEVPKRLTDNELAKRKGPTPHPRLRFWVALGIVLAAVSAAGAAWRAEIFTEYSAQKEALFRQDLIGQQLAERLDEEQVSAGLRHFGSYEEARLLAGKFASDSKRAHGTSQVLLEAAAQGERKIANVEFTTDGALASVLPRSSWSIAADANTGYRLYVGQDSTLATFDPADRNAEAHLARADAVDMAGVAVLFASAVLFLTLSEIRLRRVVDPPETDWTTGHTAGALAIVVWLIGAALFIILMLDVPGLR